jgi:hypothetical protein
MCVHGVYRTGGDGIKSTFYAFRTAKVIGGDIPFEMTKMLCRSGGSICDSDGSQNVKS